MGNKLDKLLKNYQILHIADGLGKDGLGQEALETAQKELDQINKIEDETQRQNKLDKLLKNYQMKAEIVAYLKAGNTLVLKNSKVSHLNISDYEELEIKKLHNLVQKQKEEKKTE